MTLRTPLWAWKHKRQYVMIQWTCCPSRGGLMADDMGLGKTLVCICAHLLSYAAMQKYHHQS